jgi:hypothetical protein
MSAGSRARDPHAWGRTVTRRRAGPAWALRLATALAIAVPLAPDARAQEAPAPPASAPDALADARLAGFVAARLEDELGWTPDSFRVAVEGGRVTVTVAAGSRRDERELARLGELPGAVSIELVTALDLADTPPARADNWLPRLIGLSDRAERLPRGDVFEPLLADPKTPQFYASLRDFETPGGDTTIGAVGFGETFGLWRQHGVRAGDGLQLGISAALFAQFDMLTESDDLINADYIFGVPLTWRAGANSVRLRAYHQSSHLGDEFLLGNQPERINLSFESLELLLSRDQGRMRAFLGGEWLFHVDQPESLERWGAHGGLEWRAHDSFLGLGRPVAGIDVKSWEEHEWDLDVAVSVGLERGSRRPGERRVRWMLDFYDGHSPYGQFFEDEVRYVGFGIYVGF